MFSLFTKTEPQTKFSEPEPDMLTYRSGLVEELRRLDAALVDVDSAALNFRHKHFCAIGGSIVTFAERGEDPGVARLAFEKKWTELCAERDEIVSRRNIVLKELSRLGGK
jgi:hypothetical protein